MALYSKTARIRAMYAVRLLVFLTFAYISSQEAKCAICFLVIVEMCECHFKSLDMVMPR